MIFCTKCTKNYSFAKINIVINASIIFFFKSLTVKEVQGLLGTCLPDLKTFKNVSILHQWIANQFQSDLNTLKIGLTGGRSGPLPTTAPAGNSSNNSTRSTTASTTKHASTAGNICVVVFKYSRCYMIHWWNYK